MMEERQPITLSKGHQMTDIKVNSNIDGSRVNVTVDGEKVFEETKVYGTVTSPVLPPAGELRDAIETAVQEAKDLLK